LIFLERPTSAVPLLWLSKWVKWARVKLVAQVTRETQVTQATKEVLAMLEMQLVAAEPTSTPPQLLRLDTSSLRLLCQAPVIVLSQLSVCSAHWISQALANRLTNTWWQTPPLRAGLIKLRVRHGWIGLVRWFI
jgi:hypothetical protein